VQGDGYTLHEHLLVKWDQTKVKPQELQDLPELPTNGLKLWQVFIDLHTTRRSGFNGPERFGFADLHAWQIITRQALEPWEVRALFRLDREYMAFRAREAAKSGG
jgi:hypothetical protein